MSKLYVDEMPTEPSKCPCAEIGEYVPAGEGTNPHYLYLCMLQSGNHCDLHYGNPCEYLKEIPKFTRKELSKFTESKGV